MNQDEKREVVERLVAQIKEAKAMIVTDYRGLTVTQTAEVRRALTEAGASFHVAKNTLARIAAEQAERPTLIEFLQGPTAIAFIEDDPAPAAKKLSEVARSTRILAVKGGVMNGHTLTRGADPRAGRAAAAHHAAVAGGGCRGRPHAGHRQRAERTAARHRGRARFVYRKTPRGRSCLERRDATDACREDR